MFIIPRIIKLIISVFGITYKKIWIGSEHLEKLKAENRNWIYSTWHNNILGDALLLKNQNLVSLVSSSTDGRVAAKVLELMGNQTVSGSTTRGGARALFEMVKQIRSGYLGAITPDGPRGPRYKLQEGSLVIAQKTGSPLVPFHFESTNQWIFEKSWDKHKLPKPFSTIVIRIGEPFYVKNILTKKELQQAKIEFESQMMENTQLALQAAKKIKEKNDI